MDIRQKAAYLKGLMDGMELDTSTNEGKVIAAMADLLGEMCDAIYDISDEVNETVDLVDAIDGDLGELEETVYDCCCDCCDDDCDCEECDDEAFDGYDDEPMYECTCPTCGDVVCIGESLVNEGMVECPNCGEKLEFDISGLEEDGAE